MVLRRWEPFRELRTMEDTINRLWRNYGRGSGRPHCRGLESAA